MMVMVLVFWVLVVTWLVLGVRWLLNEEKERRSNSAVEIVRQRYARGEIDRDEFEAKKRDLG